jgi:pimeloyl-ACP methyl ester carboxylesterase
MIATASDGTRLHYIVEGTGPPIVLVGGKTSDIDGAWWRYIPVLAQRLKVIALDNRGAGSSDKPDTPYSTPLMAEDALAVLRDVGETSAHWFGLSMGGMILQQLALSHPDAVRSLVLGATHCGGEHPRMGGAGTAPVVEGPLRRFANLYDARFIAEHPSWVEEDASHFGKMPLHAIVRQDQAVKQHNVCNRLSEIRQPVLILHGRQDRMVPVVRGEELQRGLPDARLQLLEGGHQVHSEQFPTVTRLILNFVAEVERRRG